MKDKELVIDRLEIYNSSEALQNIELQGKDKLLPPYYSIEIDYDNETKTTTYTIKFDKRNSSRTLVLNGVDGDKLMIIIDLEQIEIYKTKIKSLESTIKSRMKYIKRMEEGLND